MKTRLKKGDRVRAIEDTGTVPKGHVGTLISHSQGELAGGNLYLDTHGEEYCVGLGRQFELITEPAIVFDQYQTIKRIQEYVDDWYEPLLKTQVNQSLITKAKKYMTNLYRQAKLSADEKVLLKAGYINDDGTPTELGLEASRFLAFQSQLKEIVKMAEADLAEKE